MKNIDVIVPVKVPRDIEVISRKLSCRMFYVYHTKFIDNFEYVKEFIKTAKAENSKIFVSFKHNIPENEVQIVCDFALYLTKTDIDGIFVNNPAISETLKDKNVPFKIIADSYFDPHNTESINFLRSLCKIDAITVTEELYPKNLEILKRESNTVLGIDSDNLPWCANDLLNSEYIDYVIVKGNFGGSRDIFNGTEKVLEILKNPNKTKSENLPFKHTRNCYYETNHFSGEIVNSGGENFEFSKYIRRFSRTIKRTKFKSKEEYVNAGIPKITLKLSALSQIEELKKYIKKHGFNPVYAIEYGEIINTADLAVNSFALAVVKVKAFCKEYGIKFLYGTPTILIERDFMRVYNDAKSFCGKNPPDAVVINNIGYFNKFAHDPDLKDIPVETGYGINLMNSTAIRCINEVFPLKAVDFTTFRNLSNIASCIKMCKDIIPERKITVSGNIRVPAAGLCPLNDDPAIRSRLSCKAPCQNGTFAIENPYSHEIYPFVTDGFCRMHMYKEELLDLTPYLKYLQHAGLNNFIIDMNSLNEKYTGILLTNFLNSLCKKTPAQLPILTEHIM